MTLAIVPTPRVPGDQTPGAQTVVDPRQPYVIRSITSGYVIHSSEIPRDRFNRIRSILFSELIHDVYT